MIEPAIAERPKAYVTLGTQRYRVRRMTHDSLTGICDVAMLGDRIVILRRQAPELVILAPDGTLLGQTAALPQFVWGHGLRDIGDNRLAATDVDGHKVVILNGDLVEIDCLAAHKPAGFGQPFNHPCDAVQGHDGRYYVADGYGNSAVHIFDAKLRHLKSFGQPGSGPGSFSTPHSLLIDHQGRVCVADRENNRVQQFDADGNWLGQIEGLYKPMALALTPDGTLLVSDQTPRLSAYDPHGQLIGRCRNFSTYGHGLAVQKNGTIVIADMMPDGLTLLIPDNPAV